MQPDMLDDSTWGMRCKCGHTIGEHTFAGTCVECECREERPLPAQVKLGGLPEVT
jgi:hypothetical protein